jgi:hypothetical protein
LDKNSKGVFRLSLSTVNQTLGTTPTPLTENVFSDPSSMSGSERNVLVTDQGAKTLFEATNAQHWFDVQNIDPSRSWSVGKGYFFHEFSAPESAQAMSDIIYLIDDHKVFAFLRGRNRLVALSYRDRPLVDPQQIVVNPAGNTLVISDVTEQGVTTWPLLVPITVEVEPGGDISTPLAALYDYLWNEGVLPTIPIKLPYETPQGERCQDLACVIEKGRSLQPKTNVQIEQTLCAMNPSLCRKDKVTRLSLGKMLLVPNVPFDSYLSVASLTADGKSSVQDLGEWEISC